MIHPSHAHRDLAADPRHTTAIRLYWWLWFELDPVEYRPIKIHHVATSLRMDQGNVCKAFATLRRIGLIHRNGRAWPSGPYTYRIIPNPRPESTAA